MVAELPPLTSQHPYSNGVRETRIFHVSIKLKSGFGEMLGQTQLVQLDHVPFVFQSFHLVPELTPSGLANDLSAKAKKEALQMTSHLL